ncbi:MAG: alanine racemase [Methylotenera sp.]|nr:MAG: alanine racemase [Methylotenera sp.]
MSRPAIAHIRLDAFRHNYRVAKQQGGNALAVVKANAYGHGAILCAKAIANEADGFAVACLEEALALRQAGIQNPILLLEGFFEEKELAEIVANDCWLVLHAEWQVKQLLASKLVKPLQVWLKLDSGMHRLGLSPTQYISAFKELNQHKNIAKIVHMTHFANADHLNSSHTLQQLDLFKQTTQSATNHTLEEFSLANSAAVLGWPQIFAQNSQKHWSRPGIMLYGAHPIEALSDSQPLKPVMQLSAQIISIQRIQQGDSIGYGSIFTAARNTLMGVVACGYADGYPRAAVNAPVAVDGQITQVIGRVSMDMLMVDLTDIASAKVGSLVELWGDQVPANAVANSAGTIAYELFCNVKRVQFRYSDISV